jgi:hypothetical protein
VQDGFALRAGAAIIKISIARLRGLVKNEFFNIQRQVVWFHSSTLNEDN